MKYPTKAKNAKKSIEKGKITGKRKKLLELLPEQKRLQKKVGFKTWKGYSEQKNYLLAIIGDRLKLFYYLKNGEFRNNVYEIMERIEDGETLEELGLSTVEELRSFMDLPGRIRDRLAKIGIVDMHTFIEKESELPFIGTGGTLFNYVQLQDKLKKLGLSIGVVGLFSIAELKRHIKRMKKKHF